MVEGTGLVEGPGVVEGSGGCGRPGVVEGQGHQQVGMLPRAFIVSYAADYVIIAIM